MVQGILKGVQSNNEILSLLILALKFMSLSDDDLRKDVGPFTLSLACMQKY